MKWLGFTVRSVAGALLLASPWTAALAVPVLQLYVEGSEYDYDHESWVFDLSGGEPVRLWVIGNVAGPGGKGTIEDVKLSVVYPDPGSPVTIQLAPSTTGGAGGFFDPSTPALPVHLQTRADGSTPMLFDGGFLPAHGTYGAGFEWQEFALGDFALADSPVADFIDVFPDAPATGLGQISVFEITVSGEVTDVHFDAYDHVASRNHARGVFAPFSHDAGTGTNSPFPTPEPGSLALLALGLAGLGLWARRPRRGPTPRP